jgi:hypothetical protein
MVNTEFYSNAKIYKIVCNITGLIYVGSTCKKLCQRIAQHRATYKQYLKGNHNFITSFQILENGDYDIILIEEVKNCENKEQLRARERYYIESLDCVNKVIVGRSKKEYAQLNKDTIKEYQKEYRKEHKEVNKEYNKKYLETNKAKINAKKLCPHCNIEVYKRHFNQHEQTIRHQKSLNKDIEIEL